MLRLRRLCETGREALAPIAGAARRSDLCEDDPLDAWGHELALSINDLRERAEKAEAERDELRGVCDDLCVDVNRAKDARDELRATAREWFAADASAAEAEDAATHAWGRESGPAIDALHAANVRRSAARERLRTLAGEGGE